MPRTPFFLFCVAISFPLFAERAEFVYLENSPFTEVVSENPEISRFSGEAVLAGEFEFSWDIRGGEDDILNLVFFPDIRSQELIPYIVGETPVTHLVVHDIEPAMRSLLKDSDLELIRKKQKLSFRGQASIQVSNLFTAVDCGERSFVVTFVRSL